MIKYAIMGCFYTFLYMLTAFIYVNGYIYHMHHFRNLGKGENQAPLIVFRNQLVKKATIKVICPKPYVIHPKNDMQTANIDPLVYVESSGFLVTKKLSTILPVIIGERIIKYHTDDVNTTLIINHVNSHMLIRLNANKIYFLCALPDVVFDHKLTKEIINKQYRTKKGIVKPTEEPDLLRCVKEVNTAVGISVIGLKDIYRHTHGCGSIPTPQFINDVTYDEDTKIRSCTVDIMSNPNIGFYCDGYIKPSYKFTMMNDSATGDIIDMRHLMKEERMSGPQWYLFSYNRSTITVPFSAYASCIDRSTNQVKAVITIKAGDTYYCDITESLMENLRNPIVGPWCDIGLFPGATLTIKFPTNMETFPPVVRNEMQRLGCDAFDYGFYPTDMEHYSSQIVFPQYTLQNVSLDKYVKNAALNIDQSRKDEGVVVIKYVKGVRLYNIDEVLRLEYTWHLNLYKTSTILRNVRATIRLEPIMPHEFYTFKCEPKGSAVFMEEKDIRNRIEDLVIGGRELRLCEYNCDKIKKAAIHCPRGQTLEPQGCGEVAYGATLHTVEKLPKDIISDHGLASHTNTRIWDALFQHKSTAKQLVCKVNKSFSSSCSCLDDDGIETARLTIHGCVVRNKRCNSLELGDIIPIRTPISIAAMNYSNEEFPGVSELPWLKSSGKERIIVNRGIHYTLTCPKKLKFESGYYVLDGINEPILIDGNIGTNREYRRGNSYGVESHYIANVEWYPHDREKVVYRKMEVDSRWVLVPEEHSKVFSTNTQGLRVTGNKDYSPSNESYALNVRNPMGAIVISKSNEEYVSLYYICGTTRRRRRDAEDSPHHNASSQHGADGNVRNAIHEQNEEVGTGNETSVEPAKDHLTVNDVPIGNSMISTHTRAPSSSKQTKQNLSLLIWGAVDILIKTTDPYLHGCGAADEREELFRKDTIPVLNTKKEKIGCEIGLNRNNRAAFYCPQPYYTDPPNCIPLRSYAFDVEAPSESKNTHFYLFRMSSDMRSKNEYLKFTEQEVFECKCITREGILVQMIRVYISPRHEACE